MSPREIEYEPVILPIRGLASEEFLLEGWRVVDIPLGRIIPSRIHLPSDAFPQANLTEVDRKIAKKIDDLRVIFVRLTDGTIVRIHQGRRKQIIYEKGGKVEPIKGLFSTEVAEIVVHSSQLPRYSQRRDIPDITISTILQDYWENISLS